MVKADTTDRDLSCLDQNDNNTVDIAELFDVIDAYFEGNLNDNLGCVDGNDNGAVDIAELFDVIDAYFEGSPLSRPDPTPEPTVTPEPTATPMPTPSPDNGDWVYFGPDCPDAYPNCAPIASDNPFFQLRAYATSNDESDDEPIIRMACFSDSPWFIFDGGGPLIGLGETFLNIHYRDEDISDTWYETEGGSNDSERIWFNDSDSEAISLFIKEADHQDRDVRIGVVNTLNGRNLNTVIADFDVTGYAVNFGRLPCS